MQKRVLIPITNGIEEIEAIAPIDILRRAGCNVIVASIDTLQITASRNTKITADCLINDIANEPFELILIPGGPGTEHFSNNQTLKTLLLKQAEEKKYYAAICAAPVKVLQHFGLLKAKKATCHPSLWNQLIDDENKEDVVVVDDHCITSQGPGTAIPFALKCVELLLNKEKADEIATGIVADV